MSSRKEDAEYGRPENIYVFSFFDILKIGILKVEKKSLRPIDAYFLRIIGFQTIPNKN